VAPIAGPLEMRRTCLDYESGFLPTAPEKDVKNALGCFHFIGVVFLDFRVRAAGDANGTI